MFLLPLPPGTRIGELVVLRHLGSGRVADVYEVCTPAGQRLALKLLKVGLSPRLKARDRLAQEAVAIATVEHVNIVGYFGGGEFDGRLWILVELVEGMDLARTAAAGPIPLPRLIDIARQVCEGVGAAHRRGIVHRDLKPENILVTPAGVAKVADFGSARLAAWGVETTSDQEVSSALYRAPESLKKEGVATPACDVFSIGVMLYELACGVHPLRLVKPNVAQVVMKLLDYVPPPPLEAHGRDIPGDFSDLVQRALAREPDLRCTLDQLRNGLEAVQQPYLARRRASAQNLPMPGRGLALAPTELAMKAVELPATTPPTRGTTLPQEPDPHTLRSASEQKPPARTLPMAAVSLPAVDASPDRRTTHVPVEQPEHLSAATGERRARFRVARVVAAGALLIGLGIAAVRLLAGQAEDEGSPAAAPPPPIPPASASSPPATASSPAAPAPPSAAPRPPRLPRKPPRL